MAGAGDEVPRSRTDYAPDSAGRGHHGRVFWRAFLERGLVGFYGYGQGSGHGRGRAEDAREIHRAKNHRSGTGRLGTAVKRHGSGRRHRRRR